ncbi:hypothetical protein [Bacillus sp. 1NLA3E]|uniref:hypothetical protein n=1 Tax=Bacillus sp. 1NLA3E TaxID=666686 RepID=UPI000247EB55|nr:hypothetical protein [Bacillus sp. 1NLA3E]
MAVQTNCNPQSPNFCTPPAGSTPILTVSIPGGLAINLLGIHVDVCPVCVTVYTEGTGVLSTQQTAIVNNLLQAVHNLIPSIPTV